MDSSLSQSAKQGAVWFTALFPVWAILACALTLWNPKTIQWFPLSFIPYALGLIMLFMGFTVQLKDFLLVWKNPKVIAMGLGLQYGIMPFAGFLIAKILNLGPEFSAGLILVASCPGGTASNVICFLGQLNVTLSVSLTLTSTILGIILTPILSSILIGNKINVDTLGLLLSTIKIVVFPLLVGFLLSKYFQKVISRFEFLLPSLSTLFIVLIVASIVGASRNTIFEHGGILTLAVFLLHSFGFGLGYFLSLMIGKDKHLAKTISVEVGMQNSGLGVTLARENFTSHLVSVPPALSSLFHSVIASILIGLWRFYKEDES
jgi:bile acid:Na+ symporter, BASS family